jgi:hypothetical protein
MPPVTLRGFSAARGSSQLTLGSPGRIRATPGRWRSSQLAGQGCRRPGRLFRCCLGLGTRCLPRFGAWEAWQILGGPAACDCSAQRPAASWAVHGSRCPRGSHTGCARGGRDRHSKRCRDGALSPAQSHCGRATSAAATLARRRPARLGREWPERQVCATPWPTCPPSPTPPGSARF